MDNKEASYKKPRIEKFKGKFKSILGGGTILFTKTIQSIRDPDCLAIYVYLVSKPSEWNVNVRELMDHFKIGRDKVRKCLGDLCMIGLLERQEVRDVSGKFAITKYEYYLYLSPQPENQVMDHPAPENPAPENPAPENQGPYKEEGFVLEKRECKKEDEYPTSKSKPKKPSIFDYQEKAHWENFKDYQIPDEAKKSIKIVNDWNKYTNAI